MESPCCNAPLHTSDKGIIACAECGMQLIKVEIEGLPDIKPSEESSNHLKKYVHYVYSTGSVTLSAGVYAKKELEAILLDMLALNSMSHSDLPQDDPLKTLADDNPATECVQAVNKLIEKPPGFDLRTRRSDKTNQARDWTPADALYDAAEALKKQNCHQLVILWFEETDKGQNFHWRNATSESAQVSHLLVNMFFDFKHFG